MKVTEDDAEALGSVAMIFCSVLVVATMFFFGCSRGWAAELESGYLTDHPIDPSQMILATQDARYAVRLTEGCPMGAGTNVQIDRDDMALATGTEGCGYFEPIYVDPTPCFMNAESACDFALETEG